MKMTFYKVLQLILVFFNLAEKHAEKASEEAANLGNIYIENSTLHLVTGYVGNKILGADMTNGVLTVDISERALSATVSNSALNISFT